MMRKITSHIVNPANDLIGIEASSPGSGGAFRDYTMAWPTGLIVIQFQEGPINEAGVNGITHEALLAIVADRLEDFQRGPYACRENGLALGHVKAAQGALLLRTQRRMAQGTEGTHKLDPAPPAPGDPGPGVVDPHNGGVAMGADPSDRGG